MIERCDWAIARFLSPNHLSPNRQISILYSPMSLGFSPPAHGGRCSRLGYALIGFLHPTQRGSRLPMLLARRMRRISMTGARSRRAAHGLLFFLPFLKDPGRQALQHLRGAITHAGQLISKRPTTEPRLRSPFDGPGRAAKLLGQARSPAHPGPMRSFVLMSPFNVLLRPIPEQEGSQ